jgi:hypothetical protein
LIGAILFAAFDAYQVRLQQVTGGVIPYQIFLMMPYVLSILALIVVARRALHAAGIGAATGWRSSCRTARRWRRPSSPWRNRRRRRPLNPAYREDEFAFYLEDLKAKALVDGGRGRPGLRRRQRFGLTILRWCRCGRPAGVFT